MSKPVDSDLDIRYYVGLLKRRFLYVVAPFIAVFGLSIVIAMTLPPIYRSTGTILVEAQQIPADFVRSTVSTYADERIQVIRQRVMTRANLLRIVDKFDLFSVQSSRLPFLSGYSGKLNASERVKLMRERTKVTLIDAQRKNRRRGGRTTIAFTLSFEHERPDLAVRVANELVTLFLNENARARTERAAETTEFLRQESAELQKQLEAMETRIADYKQKHRDALPDTLAYRQATLSQLENDLQSTETSIVESEAEKRQLIIAHSNQTGSVSSASSAARQALTPQQQLIVLEADLSQKQAVYSERHPDIKSLKRRIKAIKDQIATEADDQVGLKAEINQLQAKLATVTNRHSAEHPEAKRLVSLLEEKQEKYSALSVAAVDSRSAVELSIGDPVVRANVAAVNDKIASLRARKADLATRIAALRKSLLQTPQVELGLKVLGRDYENSRKKYDDVKAKQLEAQLGERLEENKKAERFSLLEPPIQPEEPIRPNRKKLIAFGFVLAAASGGGLLFVVESINQSIRTAADLTSGANLIPIASIPYIVTSAEMRRRQQWMLFAIVATVVLVLTMLLGIHFLYMPLDVFIAKVISRLQI